MIMVVDLSKCKTSVGELREALKEKGKELGVDVALHSADLVETIERV